jgi:hypothetical protein
MERMLTTKEARIWGIVAVTLGIISFNWFLGGIIYPLPIVSFLSIPASALCGGIAFHRGARGLGGTAISLGAIAGLLFVFLLVSGILRLALSVFL